MGGIIRFPATFVAFVLGHAGGLFCPALRAEFPFVHRTAGTGPAVRCGPGLAGQNFPVTAAPQVHCQLSAAGLGSGFLLPQLGQKLLVMPLCPQAQVQPGAAGGGVGTGAGAG